MSAVNAEEGRRSIVLLYGERTLRRQVLARFLELSGFRVRVTAWEGDGGSEPSAFPGDGIDLAIIDTGEKLCSHPGVRRIFDDLRRALPGAPIVVVSDREDGSAVIDAMQVGARAYFPSSLDPTILIGTLRFVQNGGTFVPASALTYDRAPQMPPQSSEARAIETLGITGRELRVLELLQKGQSNKAIARELAIEEGTVKVHVHRILRKLHAHNRTQAALLARQMIDAVIPATEASPGFLQ
jgi:DNA-binding NarL/FixJ family response regulator